MVIPESFSPGLGLGETLAIGVGPSESGCPFKRGGVAPTAPVAADELCRPRGVRKQLGESLADWFTAFQTTSSVLTRTIPSRHAPAKGIAALLPRSAGVLPL
jgi:hypothetical protein